MKLLYEVERALLVLMLILIGLGLLVGVLVAATLGLL